MSIFTENPLETGAAIAGAGAAILANEKFLAPFMETAKGTAFEAAMTLGNHKRLELMTGKILGADEAILKEVLPVLSGGDNSVHAKALAKRIQSDNVTADSPVLGNLREIQPESIADGKIRAPQTELKAATMVMEEARLQGLLYDHAPRVLSVGEFHNFQRFSSPVNAKPPAFVSLFEESSGLARYWGLDTNQAAARMQGLWHEALGEERVLPGLLNAYARKMGVPVGEFRQSAIDLKMPSYSGIGAGLTASVLAPADMAINGNQSNNLRRFGIPVVIGAGLALGTLEVGKVIKTYL